MLPAGARLVLITRADPSIRIARLRAHGALGEVRAGTLAFTPQEAAEVLGVADAQVICARCEGWPAAIYLVALAGADELPHQHLSEYLTSEVLDGLDVHTRDFLVRTSVLARLSADLCDHVLERSDSAGQLAALVRANLFVVPLDEGWLRYHDLFRELLQASLAAGEAAALHRRACAWFRERGLIEEAAEHARAAGDHATVIAILEANQTALLRAGRMATMLRWLRDIPEDMLARHPNALLACAIAASGIMRPPAEVRRLLAAAQVARSEHPEDWSAFHESLAQVVIAMLADTDAGAALRAAEAAVAAAEDQMMVVALAGLAHARLTAGDVVGAREAAERAHAHPTAARRPHGHTSALAALAIIEAREGRLIAARAHADEALANTRAFAGSGTRVEARALLADATVARLDGDAERAVTVGERVLAMRPIGVFAARVALELAASRAALGEFDAADAGLGQARAALAECVDVGAMAAEAEQVAAMIDAARADLTRPAERLSPAELLVLGRMPGSASTIAAELYLSPNTVKSHLRAIYRKLDAHSRDEALARAEALGLLS